MSERTHGKSFMPLSLEVRLIFGRVAELLHFLREGIIHDLSILADAAYLLEEADWRENTNWRTTASLGEVNWVADLREVFAASTEEEVRALGYLAEKLRSIQQDPYAESATNLAEEALPKVLAIRKHLAAMRAKPPDTVHFN